MAGSLNSAYDASVQAFRLLAKQPELAMYDVPPNGVTLSGKGGVTRAVRIPASVRKL
jgi:hypothetical protein